LFFLKLSATEDSIENVSRNKLRCANFLAGRFTILVGALSTRLLFSMVMAPISGATPPLLFFSFCPLSLSLRSLAERIFFCTFSHSFFLAHSQGKKSFSALSFSPLLSRENLFLHFLSLFFPCALAREKSFSALSFSPLLSRENLFLQILLLFFWIDSVEKSFSVFSFSPLLSRENPFLYFLSLFFPC